MLIALLLALIVPAAGQRPLTIEDIYAQHPVSGTPPSAFLYSPDGKHYAYSVPGIREDDPPVLHVHDVRDGRDVVLQPAKSASRGSRSREMYQWPGLFAHFLAQGTSDDNVHLMNSISLLQAFVLKGKMVEYFAYPGSRHGVRTVAGRRDIARRMLAWWERTL